MKTTKAISMIACGLFIAAALHACKSYEDPSTTQLDAFMKRWATYESFKTPTDPEDEPLLLAALEKDPKGPWAAYVTMKFAGLQYEARSLDADGRAALYGASLSYLKPARDTLAIALQTNPQDKYIQDLLNIISQEVSLASLEAGLDLAVIKSNAESALASNTDTQSCHYGNTIYDQHSLLGRIAVREGNIEEAKKQLLAAGRTPGSPQLNSYGPDFILARELAEKGEFDTVLEFLDLVERFWAKGKQLEEWRKQLRAGQVPDHKIWK